MISKYRKLSKNTVYFLLVQFIPKLIVFLLVPLYTRKLSTADYGYCDLLINTSALAVPIFTFCIADAVFRFIISNEYDLQNVLRVGSKITLWGGVVFALICITASFFIDINKSVYIVFLIVYSIGNAIYRLETYFCRGIDSVQSITIGATVQAFLLGLLSVICLLVFNTGTNGYLFSLASSVVICDVVILVQAKLYKYIIKRKNSTKSYEKALTKKMILYSSPIIITVMGWWINSASDKYILLFFKGAASVGVYAVAYKIPAILNAFHSAIIHAFQISVISDTDDDDTDGFFSKSYSFIKNISAIICSLIIVLCIPLASVLFSEVFFLAWRYVPILTLAAYVQQMADISLSSLLKYNRTGLYAVGTIFGAILNTLLNVLLIPFWGSYGAAIATLTGYILMWLMGYIFLKRYMHFSIEKKQSVSMYILLGLQAILATMGQKYILIEIVIFIAICLINHDNFVYFLTYLKKHFDR